MNSPKEPALTLQDMPGLFSKYKLFIFTSTLLCTVLLTVAGFKLPKKYKAHFVLTIYSKYFQSPLIGDFVPGLSESAESPSQRESLIRQVLTPDYLDALGNRYGIYNSGGKPLLVTGLDGVLAHLKTWAQELGLFQAQGQESQLSADREELRSRIEIFSLNSTTFNVGFVYSDPSVTLQVTRDLYGEIIHSLLEIRLHTLINVRDAIQKRLSSLSVTLRSTPAAPNVVTGHQMVRQELSEVRNQIRALTSEYTEEHPLVKQLRDRERILVSRLENSPDFGAAREPDSERQVPEGGSGEGVRDIYSDLAKKLNYVNIAIDSDNQHQGDYFATLETPLYPSAPLWPKKGLLSVWGFALGFCGSLFVAAIREFFARSTLHAADLSHQLNLPLLGKLPKLPSVGTP